MWYIDTSALVKILTNEAESNALAAWLESNRQLAACDLVKVEGHRAVRMSDPGASPLLRTLLDEIVLIRLDDDIYEAAASLDPPSLRSLDAIHLAAALSMGADLEGVVTYDQRMAKGARMLGLQVESPGRP